MSDSVSFPGFQASLGFMIIEYTPAWDDLKWPQKKVRNMGWLMALGFPHYRNWTHRIEYNSPWQAPWLIEAPLRHHWEKTTFWGPQNEEARPNQGLCILALTLYLYVLVSYYHFVSSCLQRFQSHHTQSICYWLFIILTFILGLFQDGITVFCI